MSKTHIDGTPCTCAEDLENSPQYSQSYVDELLNSYKGRLLREIANMHINFTDDKSSTGVKSWTGSEVKWAICELIRNTPIGDST